MHSERKSQYISKGTDLFGSDLFYLTKNILTLKHYLVFFEKDFVGAFQKQVISYL